jgi:hypothetical protein
VKVGYPTLLETWDRRDVPEDLIRKTQ